MGRMLRIAGVAAVAWVLLSGLSGCGPQPPVRIGFLGELADGGTSFSEDARNGVLLGIEQVNAAGGVRGRPLELEVQGYTDAPESVLVAAQALLDARVDAVVGPYSNPRASKLLPLLDASRVVWLGPTLTGESLAQRDDQLIQFSMTVRENARATARMLRDHGWQQLTLVRDLRNAESTVAWSDAFRVLFTAKGGTVLPDVDFTAGPQVSFDAVARQLVGRPGGLLFVTSAVDTARLAQQLAKLGPPMPMAATLWAVDPDLLELGGAAVDGVEIAQVYDSTAPSPRYRAFRDAYRARFDRPPSYSATVSFDAVMALVEALRRAKPGEPLRDAVLAHGPYEGLQYPITFDRFGDASPPVVRTVVRSGQFERWR